MVSSVMHLKCAKRIWFLLSNFGDLLIFCPNFSFFEVKNLVHMLSIKKKKHKILFFTGWFARDPSVLCNIGRILLQLAPSVPKRIRRFIIADDLFELSKVPKQKTVHVVRRVTEKLSGCKLRFCKAFYYFRAHV